MNYILSQVVNLLRRGVVNLNRHEVVRFNRRGVVNLTGACSVTFNSNYSDFKKETVFLFKLDNQVILSNSQLQKKDTLTWFLEKKERYALISLGNIGRYELDFLQKNNKKYMRLRNEISVQKNMGIIEYFFTKSNL